jgi:CheY-like chemotaxis protein
LCLVKFSKAVSDSMEALEKFQNQPDNFDLLITDITTPKLTGSELAEAVQAIKPSMPIIMCTGHSATFLEEEALVMGIKRYLLKPVVDFELLKAVREVLDERQGLGLDLIRGETYGFHGRRSVHQNQDSLPVDNLDINLSV